MSRLPSEGDLRQTASRYEEKDVYRHFILEAANMGAVVVTDELLARHCTFRIGGPADLFAAPNDIDILERLAKLASEFDIPTAVLGGGSNVLVSDRGVRGLVIANQAREFGFSRAPGRRPGQDETGIHPDPGPDRDEAQLVVDSGVTLAGLARWAIREGWSGLEWAVSIPGTVGGAVVGNAGAHGGQIADNLAWVLMTEPSGGREIKPASELEFSYRDSALKRQLAIEGLRSARHLAGQTPSIILRAAFQLTRGDVAVMTACADTFLARRRTSQPTEPSAGSVFRNPSGDHAGRLIETVGLKGYQIGGAQVSVRHANFIVNTGGARAADVVELIDLVQSKVLQSTGIELVPEILFVGDWDNS